MAMNPITWPEIDAWARLHRVKPLKWELDALTAIDDVFRMVMAEEEKA